MNIGRLNKRILLLKQETKEDELGQEIPIWIPHKEVWATVKPLRGRESYEAKKIRSELTYKITTRYHKDIVTDMRIQFQNKTLEIKAIVNVEEGNYMLEMECIEYIEKKENNGRF